MLLPLLQNNLLNVVIEGDRIILNITSEILTEELFASLIEETLDMSSDIEYILTARSEINPPELELGSNIETTLKINSLVEV